jgi:hypothetical protein
LDALEGYHSSLEVLICLLGDAVSQLLQLLLEAQQVGVVEQGGGGGGGVWSAFGGEFGAGTADGGGLLIKRLFLFVNVL